LNFFSRSPSIVRSDDLGRRLLKARYLAQTNSLLSLTRVGPDSRILYTYPEEQAIGRDLSDQAHIKTIFATHQPVVSEVFMSVQGFQCVALHVPVFDEGRFAGTLAALFPFEAISRKHVEGIGIGETGYAILLSREGIELYCPITNHVRRSIYETCAGFTTVQAMADRMLQAETGTCIYDFNPHGSDNAGLVRKRAFFMPIKLENTFWSICVTAPEAEALGFIRGFRDRWIVGVSLLFVAFGVWGFFLARAFLTIHRERTRREAEARIREAEREREKAVAESEARFRTYFEDSLLAMAISSPDKQWLAVNDRFAQFLGYSKEELRALTWVQVTHPADLGPNLTQFDRMLAGEIEGFSLEKRFIRKDQTVVHAILSNRLVRRADGRPDYCLVQLQDISERKRAEEEKGRLEDKLRQVQKLEAIGQLAGGVAHDYNNLLTVQLGHLSLLQQADGLPADVRESLAEIEKSAQMAAQLTRQLLAFSRRQMLQIKRLDLNEVLDQLLKMLRRVLREDISLELKMAREPLWLDADAGMMEQVVMNLVVNARDAMPAGGRLTLSTEAVEFTAESLPAHHEPPPFGVPALAGSATDLRDTPDRLKPGLQTSPPRGSGVQSANLEWERSHPEARPGRFICLIIADTGRGMDAETRQRIFEPFFTTKEVGKGTGLGLATVYGIVTQHKGWIEVDSAENQGTVFRVFYPAASLPKPGAEADMGPSEPVNLRGAGETILLAEDNPAVRQTLQASLVRLNYRVLSASSSPEAFNLWLEHRAAVRLLLTDMVMVHGGNGLELATRLRAERPDLPVVIMSGYSQELVAGGLSAGMAFLPKPCTIEVLARTLQDSLKQSRTHLRKEPVA
jgi:PAS domain S-box-containing protein